MARPVVLFPDAVATVIAALTAAYSAHSLDAPLLTNEVPNPRPEEFFTIQRVGGPRRDLVTDEAQLVFDAWSRSMADAHDLAQTGRALLLSLPGTVVAGTTIGRIQELSGPHEDPDPVSQQARFSFGALVALRGGALPA